MSLGSWTKVIRELYRNKKAAVEVQTMRPARRAPRRDRLARHVCARGRRRGSLGPGRGVFCVRATAVSGEHAICGDRRRCPGPRLVRARRVGGGRGDARTETHVLHACARARAHTFARACTARARRGHTAQAFALTATPSLARASPMTASRAARSCASGGWWVSAVAVRTPRARTCAPRALCAAHDPSP